MEEIKNIVIPVALGFGALIVFMVASEIRYRRKHKRQEPLTFSETVMHIVQRELREMQKQPLRNAVRETPEFYEFRKQRTSEAREALSEKMREIGLI